MKRSTIDRLRQEIAHIEGRHRSRRTGKGRKPDPATLASFDCSLCDDAEVEQIAAGLGLKTKPSRPQN